MLGQRSFPNTEKVRLINLLESPGPTVERTSKVRPEVGDLKINSFPPSLSVPRTLNVTCASLSSHTTSPAAWPFSLGSNSISVDHSPSKSGCFRRSAEGDS